MAALASLKTLLFKIVISAQGQESKIQSKQQLSSFKLNLVITTHSVNILNTCN